MGGCTSKPMVTAVEEDDPAKHRERKEKEQKREEEKQLRQHRPSATGGILSKTPVPDEASSDNEAYDKIRSPRNSGRNSGPNSGRNSGSAESLYTSAGTAASGVSGRSFSSIAALAPSLSEKMLIRKESRRNMVASSTSQPSTSDKVSSNKASSSQASSRLQSRNEDDNFSNPVRSSPSPPPPPPPPSSLPPFPRKAKQQPPTADPHWEHLFATLSPRLLDPEDLPAVLDATISKTINRLSPAEVSFVRRRVKESIRATVGAEGGNGDGGHNGHYHGHHHGHGGSSSSSSANALVKVASAAVAAGTEGKRASITKKVGRLVISTVGSYSSNHGDKGSSSSSGNNNDGSAHSSHPALDESADRVKSTKDVLRKERLLDITMVRKVFEGGERALKALQAGVGAEPNANGSGNGNGSSSLSSSNPNNNNGDPPYRRRSTGKAGAASPQEPADGAAPSASNKSPEQFDRESIEKIDVYGSAFLMLLYMSDARWDYVTEIARLSAKEAGLTMDVNKLALQEGEEEGGNSKSKKKNSKKQTSASSRSKTKFPSPPRPPSFTPPSELYNLPDLTVNEPGGIHLTSLCFLIAMALRGTRRQRLSLLFYVLLPHKELNLLLASHPAGGLPTWLLETDAETVLSYDSLSYYYNYDGVLLPSSSSENEDRHRPSAAPDRKRLCIDAKSSVEVLATMLAESMEDGTSSGRNNNAYGTRRLNGMLSLPGGEKPETTVLDQLSKEDANTPSSVKCQNVSAMLLQASRGDTGTTTTTAAPSGLPPQVTEQFAKFAELSTAIVKNSSLANNAGEATARLAWSMREFVEWADVAINEPVLDAILRSLFGTGILPSARMERRLVEQRWVDWNLQHLEEHTTMSNFTFTSKGDRNLSPVRGGLRKMFTSPINEQSDHPFDEVATMGSSDANYVWGGIGGADGKGGLGHGVLYCIDKMWWDDWVAFTGWKICKTDEEHLPCVPSSLKRPNEMSTERLINRSADLAIVSGSRGSYEVMEEGLVIGKDYVLVPPGVWNVLYEMYGGGPPLPRMVLPNDNENRINMDGEVDGDNVSIMDGSVEVIPMESQHYPREIPTSVRVAIHPWIFHCQICDPQQPYRRGDAGPMSIRIMAMPNQPLSRLFAEIVVRLPISHPKGRDSNGEGKARLWRFEVGHAKVPNAASRYGPWALLCKNRYTEIPVSTTSYDKYEEKWEERWEKYADQHSVKSIGLSDGMRLMFEYAVANKDGNFTWPREAAAKATTARRIAHEDVVFRLHLRGFDGNGEPLKTSIMKKTVDAMDSTGRWYQAIIVNVDNSTKTANPDDGQDEDETSSHDGHSDVRRENTHVRVHFIAENHEEWIDVKSDRLAVKGRMTSSSMRHIDSGHDSDEEPKPSESKSRIAGGINKKKDTSEISDPNSNAVCLFPSYGATGLINLGNTCYANSGWQCMAYLPLLRAYLLSGQFKINGDINKDNPLGTGGKILEEFSELLHLMWSGKYGARAPQKFRSILAKSRPQYSGADQQDAQELLNDMFDMLHEDGNRIRKKPYVEALEDKFVEKTELARVGEEAWRRFLRRNRSVISDLSMGQVYNRVTCPHCNHSSKNFDPFTMLSLPFPTVAEVIFRCTIVRRATALNCPNTLYSIWKHPSQKYTPKTSTANISPPSQELITEEYLIPMSRLADIGDLKMKLQNLSGIPSKDLRVCKREDIESNASDNKHNFTRMYTKVSALADKEGPCIKLLQQSTLDDVSSATIARIVAFESTLVVRPIEIPNNDRHSMASRAEVIDDASTTADEMSTDDSSSETVIPVYQNKAEEKLVQEMLKVYGDEKECVVFDTNPTPLAKVISRSLWPKSPKDFTLGLRVDAIDHRNHWFPGSVIEIVVDGDENNPDEEAEERVDMEPTTKVKVHFDNFSTKWDEIYSIESFNESRVCPLYSHATPRHKPTEFAVHHRALDRKTKTYYLFGQSYYIQCHNEWSTARAGAHILAQASRFLEIPPFRNSENGKKSEAVDRKIAEKERNEARKVISRVIEALIKSDRKYMESAIACGKEAQENEEHAPFDITVMSNILSKKLSEVLPLLPFDVRVTTASSPLGTNEEESSYPFSLVRTIGNYMNARHALVLNWRERPEKDNNQKPLAKKQFLYSPPFLASHRQSRALLYANQKDPSGNATVKRHPSSSHGGLSIGVCLTEFCKEQQLDATGCWRCPVCKREREGKQSMTLWNLPDLLTFHLKRFNASSRWREKISTRVDFPLTGLNMREWCDKESPLYQESDDEGFIYDLVGVVNHYGGMTGGHYVAMCKATACGPDGDEEVAYSFNGEGVSELEVADEESAAPSSGWRNLGRTAKEKDSSSNASAKAVAESAEPLWLQFDDDLVEPLPPRNIVSETAYVLFYRRRRMRPANIAKYSPLG